MVMVEFADTPVAPLIGTVELTEGRVVSVVADVVNVLVNVTTALPAMSVKPLTCTL
jgi:hypothetical protein